MNPALHTASDVMHLLETKEIAYYGLRDAYRAFRPTWKRVDPVAERLFAHDFATRWAIFEAVAKIAQAEVAEARQVAIRLSFYPSETVWLALSCMDAQLPGTVSPGDFIDLSARLAVAAKGANFPMNIPANVLIGIPNVPSDFGTFFERRDLDDTDFGIDGDTAVDQPAAAPNGSGPHDTVRPQDNVSETPGASAASGTTTPPSSTPEERDQLFASAVEHMLEGLSLGQRLSRNDALGLMFIIASFTGVSAVCASLRAARRSSPGT